jgi:uncharacterized RmlC-like cupin family protein
MIEKEMLVELFNNAKNNNKALLLKNFMPEVPKWEDFINNLYNKTHSEQISDHKNLKHVKDVVIYNNLDLFVSHAANSNDENELNGLQNTIKILQDYLNVEFFNIKALINFAGNEGDYWKHEDINDVISWHCIGNVEWKIYNGDEYESFILSPGDLLYCPKGVTHHIIVDKPRASIVMDYFNPLDN